MGSTAPPLCGRTHQGEEPIHYMCTADQCAWPARGSAMSQRELAAPSASAPSSVVIWERPQKCNFAVSPHLHPMPCPGCPAAS